MHAAILTLLLALCSAQSALAAGWMTNAFRTSSGALVNRGDSMIEVLQSAGEPLRQRVLSEGVTIGGLAGLTREQWIYRGNDGYYVVTFAGDRVAEIEVLADR